MVLYRCFLFNLQSVSVLMTPLVDSWGHLWYVRNWCGDALVSTAYTHFSKVIYEDSFLA